MHLSGNAYYTQHGNASLECGSRVLSVVEAQAVGLEQGSVVSTLPAEATMLRWARARLEKWIPPRAGKDEQRAKTTKLFNSIWKSINGLGGRPRQAAILI